MLHKKIRPYQGRIRKLLALILSVAMAAGCFPLASFASEAENTAQSKAFQDSPFQHPGLLHTKAAFEKIKENVDNGVSPNKETWDQLYWNTYSNPNWNPRPLEYVTRGGRDSINQLRIDIRRAYQNALVWKISGSADHGAAACRIINAWSSVMKGLGGNADRFLAAGLQGYELANIGEIMRDHPEFDTEGLQRLLLNVFYPMNDDFLIRHNDAYIGNYWANWELANLASMISIGVYCDREDIYERALDYVKTGIGNGSFYHMMPYVFEEEGLVQWQETTRDQGHTTLGLVLCGVICETAWNQGDDLYRLSDNRFMKATEYVAKYNSLGEEVASAPYEWRQGRDGKSVWQPAISGASRGSWRPIYAQMYNHYVNRRGLEMPNVKRMMDNADGVYIEGGAGNSLDELGWYTLTYANISDPVEDQPVEGELSDGVYRILSSSSGKSLVADAEGNLSSAPKGTRTEEWWMLKNKGDGEYTVTNLATGKAMQVNDEGTAEMDGNVYSRYYAYGTQIGTGEPNGSLSQSFAFLKEDYGAFRIVPSLNYLVLALEGNNTADDARIVQWRNDAWGAYWNDNNPAQRWVLEKATEAGAEFTFDTEDTGFESAYAKAAGSHTLVGHGNGKALSLNGDTDFLTVLSKTQKGILAGEKRVTISFEAKPEISAQGANWVFYAAPDGDSQAEDQASYIGIKEENGTVIVVRQKNGTEKTVARAALEEKKAYASAETDGWYKVSAVFTETETIVYINGEEKAREASTASLPEILGEGGVFQIGKANLGNGEYYEGLLDNFKIAGHAMTEGEALFEAAGYAKAELPEVLADFTFDDVETGLQGGAAVARGVYSLQDHDEGKALYLNGFRDFLKVTGQDGNPLIPGGLVKEMTISLQARQDGGSGWVFYATPNEVSQNFLQERYLGILENNGVVTAQRYANQGERLPSAEASSRAHQWHYLTVVLTEGEIILYDNGEEAARAENTVPLSEILGGDSILQIGKANWGKGEYFQGLIDNYKIISRAWTEAEVQAEAIKYVDKSELQSVLDHVQAAEEDTYSQERWNAYHAALSHAEELLKSSNALQSAINTAADTLKDLQAWMRLDEALYDAVPESQETSYTQKSWSAYKAALLKAQDMQKEGKAARQEIEDAARELREFQAALLEKSGTIAEAIAKIHAIGQVERTLACSQRVILARQSCNSLQNEELQEVTNLSILEAAESAMKDYLAEFTFDNPETGFMGGQAVAEGACTIQNKALYLNGTESNWLNITKADTGSLLTGRNELTITFAVKPESDLGNWFFYAAPNQNTQILNQEVYLGALENNGTITAERYKNQGARPLSPEGSLDTSDWSHIALVYTQGETILYINGEEASRAESEIPLPDIFGGSSILQIGKANWGTGEYYRGWLDDFRILGTAADAETIQKEAAAFQEKLTMQRNAEAVMEKINAIGEVTALAGCRERIREARASYDALPPAAKALVENEDLLTSAENTYQQLAAAHNKILAKFTLHNAESGLKGYGAAAAANGSLTFTKDPERGNVLSLDGTAWLTVTKEDGTPLLGDQEELTISYYSKAGRTETNWPFYAAPHGDPQNGKPECYIGILENGNRATAERFLNGRQPSAAADYDPGWNHIVAIYEADCTKIYVNGNLKATAENNGKLKEILGSNSILQIGKANWGDGEFYKGLLDDFTIYNYALSEEEISVLETTQPLDKSALSSKITEAKAIQKEAYTEESYAALQTAIASAEEALETVGTEAEVLAAVQALQAAIDALQEKEPEPLPELDKSALESKLAEARGIEKGNYTEESYTALQAAIASAEEALETVGTEAEVLAAVQALQAAIDALQEKEPEPLPELDKSALESKLAEARGIEKGNYTEESYTALQAAIASAEKALETVGTEAEVLAAVQALQAVIDALKEQETPKPQKVLTEAIKISPEKKALTQGQSVSLAITVIPSNADNPSYGLTSSNPAVASISGTTIIARKEGTATITAKASDGSGVTAQMEITVRLKPVTKIQATQSSANQQVKLTFSKIAGATGYDIYRSTKKNGTYKKIGTTKKNAYTDKKSQKGKTYFYKITATAVSPAYNSSRSSQYASIKVLASPTVKCKSQKSRKVTAAWKKVSNAQGYVIYTSTSKTKGFKAAKTLTKGTATKATFKAKKTAKKLYIKVRAFYQQNGKRFYGSYSKPVAVKIKK